MTFGNRMGGTVNASVGCPAFPCDVGFGARLDTPRATQLRRCFTTAEQLLCHPERVCENQVGLAAPAPTARVENPCHEWRHPWHGFLTRVICSADQTCRLLTHPLRYSKGTHVDRANGVRSFGVRQDDKNTVSRF